MKYKVLMFNGQKYTNCNGYYWKFYLSSSFSKRKKQNNLNGQVNYTQNGKGSYENRVFYWLNRI